MTTKRCVAALLTMIGCWLGPQAQAQDKLPVPPGGDPALACGQVPDGRAYWTEYAYCDRPVLRINRNGLYERCGGGGAGSISQCWDGGGTKHVKDLLERARQARAAGYQRVVAAGQSFGGAISVEANAAAPDLFYAMLAFSPGHGSDAGGGSANAYYNLDRQILDVVGRQKSGRVVISFPADDNYHPNRWNDPIGPKARTLLQTSGLPFVVFDNTSPIHGHSAVRLTEFSKYYGDCLRDFLEPSKTPPAGETKCPPPLDAQVVTAK
jgi:pimeloyl-ACP methyl ester carboxylesterase